MEIFDQLKETHPLAISLGLGSRIWRNRGFKLSGLTPFLHIQANLKDILGPK